MKNVRFGPKADIDRAAPNVSFGPEADVRAGRTQSSCGNCSRPTFPRIHTLGREKIPGH